LTAFTWSSETVGSAVVRAAVVLDKGAAGDLMAGDAETEALEDMLADLEDSFEPLAGPS